MNSNSLLDNAKYLQIADCAAQSAARLLVGVSATEIRSKSNPRDLVTEWDGRAESVIAASLRSAMPDALIVGEEHSAQLASAAQQQWHWLVDPIDGTVNFAHGIPHWAISIALAHGSQVVAGVVVAPALGWWFGASLGNGAAASTAGLLAPRRRIHVSAVSELQHALLASGFPYDRATSPQNNFAQWEHMQRTAGACRRFGAASLDLCMVAHGWFDGYWEQKLQPWDTAAGALIVAEAGGQVTSSRGKPFSPHDGDIIASNGVIHAALKRELALVRDKITTDS
jgi:myo-inositol-1(or 4)-monophosphatase